MEDSLGNSERTEAWDKKLSGEVRPASTYPPRPPYSNEYSIRQGTRQTAKGFLQQKICRIQQELNNLKVLEASLPEAMLPEADVALRDIFCQALKG